MDIVVSGGTGLIGKAITEIPGNNYFIITRGGSKTEGNISFVNWNELERIRRCDVVINLSGFNIGSKRWNHKIKEEIIRSRIESTRSMVKFIASLEEKPDVFLSGSAIGYYGYDDNSTFDESSPPGTGFLAELANAWEDEALKASKLTRTVLLRTSNVLSSRGGFLSRIMNTRSRRVYYFGSGVQPVSWIHLEDYVSAVSFLIENETISGPVNMASPSPVSFSELAGVISKEKGYKTMRIPDLIGRIILGSEMYRELMSGQKVIPKKLLDSGFQFKYPDIESAVRNL
ncbi:TIGR01777 family protein [Thermoplasma sp. Kam2015]|uniref:TIGR01777 family oxidoreductase n=1 Tax=Thermoplasma sp. Kam2015 TaxID=2094122 RepID=UPI000D891512|nr:TIGR01777 family oxidoreductase [Thermoplasma sp. Kam2015]PYB67724.1 TIGR01777 family protein [Thermoplasma sp. Kam2015]